MPEKSPPELDEIRGPLTAPLLPTLEHAKTPAPPPPVPAGATTDAAASLPPLPTLNWESTAPRRTPSVSAPAPVAERPTAPGLEATAPPAAPMPSPPPAEMPLPPVAAPVTPAEAVVASPTPTPVSPAPVSPAPVPPAPVAPAPVAHVPAPPAVEAPISATPPPAATVPAAPVVAASVPAASAAADPVPAAALVDAIPALPQAAALPSAARAAAPAPDAAVFDVLNGQAVPAKGPSFGGGAKEAAGAIVRTLLIAAVVAAAVFGGRYAWQWNEDRHNAAVDDILPAETVLAPDARYVSYELGGTDAVVVEADLQTGDVVVQAPETTLARGGGAWWAIDPSTVDWAPASAELLDLHALMIEQVDRAAVVTVSDVLPPVVHPYLTVTGDETVTLPGVPIGGPDVIEIGLPDVEDDAASDDRISTSGNADPILDDVVDNIANDPDAKTSSPSPNAPAVAVRHLTVEVDRLALTTAEPHVAHDSGLDGATPVVIELWLDSTGVVRKMFAPTGTTHLSGAYDLVSMSSTGVGPLEGAGIPAAPPTEEAAP